MNTPISSLVLTPVVAGKNAVYRAQLIDDTVDPPVPIPANSLDTLTLSLYDNRGNVINGVLDVNILNTGRGAVDAQGNLVITFLPGDTAIYGPIPLVQGGLQYRRMILNWTYNGGVMSGGHEADFSVQQLGGV